MPAAAHSELATLYGPGSPAALTGHQQWFAIPSIAFRYLAMNTERPLFATANMRKAVNFAIDRPGMIALRGAHAGVATTSTSPR